MAIAAVVKLLAHFRIYDEAGELTATIIGNISDTVVGYTQSTFALQQDHFVLLFDEHGKQIKRIPLLRPGSFNAALNRQQ